MKSYKKIIGILFLGCAAGNVQALQQLARLARPAATAARQALQAKPKMLRPVNQTVQPQIKTVHNNPASLAPLVATQKTGQEQQKKSWNNAWAALGATGAATAYALQKEPVLCEGAIDSATFDYSLLENMDSTEARKLIQSIPTSTWGGYLFTGYNPRADFCKKALDFYIDNNKIEDLHYYVLNILFEQLSDEQKEECFLKILNFFIDNNKIERLDSSSICVLYIYMPEEQKQEYSLKILNSYIDNNKIEKLSYELCNILVYELTDTQKPNYSVKIINSFIDNDKIEESSYWMLYRLFTLHLLDAQKQEYSLKIIQSFIDNDKIEKLESWFLDSLFEPLRTEQKQEYSLEIVNYFIDNNTIEQIDSLILLKLVVNINVPVERIKDFPFALTSLLNFSEEECPTTQHINKHYPQILKILETSRLKIPEIKELCIEMINYSGQEQEKGSVTFLHGQSWNWSLYETFYKKLEQQKGKNIADDFMYFRYNKSSLISEEKATAIAKTGVKDYTKERFGILFCNLAFMANDEGSNSIAYVAENSDQSTLHQRNEQEILNLFKGFGLYEAAQKVYSSHQALFDRAQDLHKKASLYGNFVTVSIPKDLVNTLVYPTESGGPRIKYRLEDGTETNDVLYMAEHADLLPFETEFAIVLGPKMTDPYKAKEAGIEIKQWNAADPEIITQRDAIIDEIIQLVIQEAEKK